MIELISNSRYGNGIAVYLRTAADGTKKIVKTSYTARGILDLLKEFEGWTWYKKNLLPCDFPLNCVVTTRRDSFIRIEIDFIDGVTHDYTRPIGENISILERCLNWYIQEWPYHSDRLGPIHGDLSLGNIIERGDRLFVIDWEHFAPDKAPWGVDIVSLLLETLYFSKSRLFGIRPQNVAPLKSLFGRIVDTGRLDRDFIANPLCALKAFVQRTSDVWGDDQVSKLPVLHFTDSETEIIDRVLGTSASRSVIDA